MMSILLEPINLGELKLKNRIIMAPLTRCRADDARVPTALMVEYYRQRASAGLIISEATSISPMGVGYPNTPGIWHDDQIRGWHDVLEAVHAQGGKMVLQLWHVGRISDPVYLDGKKPVAPSAVKPAGHPSLVRPIRDFVVPHALTVDEIKATIADFKQAAKNAKQAGFDGVEIHGANGYLPDQFLQDSTNQRTDSYGGSLERRARFMLEVTDVVCEIWGPGKVGMHLAPRCDAHDMGDSQPLKTFEYICQQLADRKLAFVCARAKQSNDGLALTLKSAFGGRYIINQELTKNQAEQLIENGNADAAAWGQLFIANPDLVTRFADESQLNQPLSEFFYAGGERGYVDYPLLDR
jgi:2,4-dienoyl-CoA reductase-like NADH-dependent reductase (Old Yellow Enzyme family)